MNTVSPRAVHAVLKERGQEGWVELTRRYGKTFRHAGVVATCEPEAVRTLLMERPHAEVRPAIHKLLGKLPGADGILFMDGDKWLKRTRAVMPVFDRHQVDSFASSLRETTLAHAAAWQQQGRVADLFSAVQQLGAASILRMGYGLDPDDPLAVELGRAMVNYKQRTMVPDPRQRLDEFGILPEKILALPWILAGLVRMKRDAARVEAAVRRLMEAGRAASDTPGWLARLSAAGLSEKELAEELTHLYTAFNAIDYVVAAALYELARNRHLMNTLRAELDSTLDERQPPAREDLQRLPQTNAFMLEILRRYPVTMGVVRRTGKPMDLGGEELPAGTQVLILLHALHHHPDFWEDADELKPERWIASPAPKVAFSYVPFLDGSRKCIGRSMAEMQLLVILGTLVRRFDVRVFAEAVVPPFMIPRFAEPIPFVIERPLST